MALLEPLSPDRIEADWERIGALLQPSIQHDEHRTAIDVYRDLMNGTLELFDIDIEGAKGVVVTEVGLSMANVRCLWVCHIGGRISPRLWCLKVWLLMLHFEELARLDGCKEMRLEGRDWHRIFPDWERLDERPGRNELRKVL